MKNRTRLKICGMKEVESVQLAVRLGVDALGFVFYAGSVRNTDPESVRELIKGIPPFVSKVGVFVKQSLSEIIDIVRFTGLDTVQLHGNYDRDFVSELSERIALPLLLAQRVHHLDDEFLRGLNWKGVSAYLIDRMLEGRFGGTGKRFSIADLSEESRQILSTRVILAGGLSAKNLKEVIENFSPYGVDLSGGVEEEAGKKSLAKIEELFRVYHSIRRPS